MRAEKKIRTLRFRCTDSQAKAMLTAAKNRCVSFSQFMTMLFANSHNLPTDDKQLVKYKKYLAMQISDKFYDFIIKAEYKERMHRKNAMRMLKNIVQCEPGPEELKSIMQTLIAKAKSHNDKKLVAFYKHIDKGMQEKHIYAQLKAIAMQANTEDYAMHMLKRAFEEQDERDNKGR